MASTHWPSSPTGSGGAVNKIGPYTLSLSNGVETCTAQLSLSGTACTDVQPLDYCLGGTPATQDKEATAIQTMAVGDQFTAANFKVTITEVSSASGLHTGKGIAELILPGKLSVEVNVIFEGAQINDCYQLTSATEFITDYDPNWFVSSAITEKDLVKLFSDAIDEIQDILAQFSGNCEDLTKIEQKIIILETKLNGDATIAEQYKTETKAAITELKTAIISLRSCSNCVSSNITGNISNCTTQIADAVKKAENVLALTKKVFQILENEDELGNILNYEPFIKNGELDGSQNSKTKVDDWLPLTSIKFLQLAEKQGIKNEINRDYPHLNSQERNDKFIQRLGRIFEKTALNSLQFSTNSKIYSVIDKSIRNAGVKPDAKDKGGVGIKRSVNGVDKSKYYWWDESTFIEVKYTLNGEQTIFENNNDYQILGYIDVLKRMEDAKVADNLIGEIFSIGRNVRKLASNAGGAFLHIITPSGVSIDEKIKIKAGENNIWLYHSVMEYKEPTTLWDLVFRVKTASCINLNYMKIKNNIVRVKKFAVGEERRGAWEIK